MNVRKFREIAKLMLLTQCSLLPLPKKKIFIQIFFDSSYLFALKKIHGLPIVFLIFFFTAVPHARVFADANDRFLQPYESDRITHPRSSDSRVRLRGSRNNNIIIVTRKCRRSLRVVITWITL